MNHYASLISHDPNADDNKPRDPLSSLPSSSRSSIFPSVSALSLLRTIQCSRCSLPLVAPLRLPCGNTFCRPCLPPVHARRGITYPAGEGRKLGFECPWGNEEVKDRCAGSHCVGDCGVDVLMGRVVEVFDSVVGDCNGEEDGGGLGRLYRCLKEGRLGYDATGAIGDNPGNQTEVERLKEAIRNELDCQVCYSLILDPITTPCGHTFCRQCVGLIMYHSDLCPLCRQKLNMPSNIQSLSLNKGLATLIDTLLPDQIAEQRQSTDQDNELPVYQRTIPLFVSSVAFPTMPIFLHIFEPRYRLMIRRVMSSRDHTFGMVAYNRARRRQDGLGRTQFMQYGTLMAVDRFEPLSDGRSLVIATGVSRFRVTKADMRDGYYVGEVERLDDVPITEEENCEAAETSVSVESEPLPSLTGEGSSENQSQTQTQTEQRQRPLETMSTQELFDLSMAFVRKQHRQGAPWLHPRALMAYGNEPTDPSRFPWWFGCILNVSEEDRYDLLPSTSIRERLKITARWVRKLEARQGMRPPLTSVL